MIRHPRTALALPLLLGAFLAPTPAASADATAACVEARSPRLDRAGALIRTSAQLAAWLAEARADDPLTALPAPARGRFLESLRFGPWGVQSFQSEALQAGLSASEAWRLLALFGLQATLAALPALPVRSPEDAEVEAWRRAQQ